jgi:DedD protein
LAESQDATLLQRRARRRLVGAIALVVLVVIILPVVLDKEPSPIGQDLVIQIPAQDAGKFKTRVLPPSVPAPAAPEGAPDGVKSAPAQPASPKQPAVAPQDQKPAGADASDAARARALLEGKEAWVVRLGAFSTESNVSKLRDKLTAAGVKSYTEAAKGPKGEQTRVRAGPFESRLEAEQAQERLKAAGISPGSVGPR